MRDGEASAEYQSLASILPDDFSNPDDTLSEIRAKFDQVHGHDPGPGVEVEATKRGVWVRPTDGDPGAGAVFFVHGGGFVTSPAMTYAFYGANIARACRRSVFIAEYRLAPETRFPGQLDDLAAAYEELLTHHAADDVIVMGDSCGGGMALSFLVGARDRGSPLPAAFVSLSGWFDLTASGESAVHPVGRDPLLDAEWLRRRGRDYVGPEGDPRLPGASPLFAELHGLPPMLLQAGEFDRCRSDAERLATHVADNGGHAVLDIWPGMPHGFQGLVDVIPEAANALAVVRQFLD